MVLVVKNLPANAIYVRDMGLIPGSGRCPGEGNGKLLQYSCPENPMDRGKWQVTVHRVAQSQTRLKWIHTHILFREDIYLKGINWWILRMHNTVTFLGLICPNESDTTEAIWHSHTVFYLMLDQSVTTHHDLNDQWPPASLNPHLSAKWVTLSHFWGSTN